MDESTIAKQRKSGGWLLDHKPQFVVSNHGQRGAAAVADKKVSLANWRDEHIFNDKEQDIPLANFFFSIFCLFLGFLAASSFACDANSHLL
jgi:hypothetical protein